MTKVLLDLDTLAVESFALEQTSGAVGTVSGHEAVTLGHSCFETDCCPVTRATCTC